MSKNGSNKGIFIFWGGIAIVLAIVLLLIFLPRTSAAVPYANINAVIITLEDKDSNNKTINYYAESILNDGDTDQANKDAVKSLYNIQQALAKSNDFCQTALLYTTPNDGFNKLVKQQNKEKKAAQTALRECQDYCKAYITPFFNGTQDANRAYRLNETVKVFVEKYTAVMLELSAFYQTTAQIISGHATTCMEINPTMKEKHLTLMTSARAMVADDNFTTLNTATLLIDATAVYAEGYYTTFI